MNCSAGRQKLCTQSGSNGGSGLGLDSGLAPQKLPFLWQLYSRVGREEEWLILAEDEDKKY